MTTNPKTVIRVTRTSLLLLGLLLVFAGNAQAYSHRSQVWGDLEDSPTTIAPSPCYLLLTIYECGDCGPVSTFGVETPHVCEGNDYPYTCKYGTNVGDLGIVCYALDSRYCNVQIGMMCVSAEPYV